MVLRFMDGLGQGSQKKATHAERQKTCAEKTKNAGKLSYFLTHNPSFWGGCPMFNP